MTAAKARLAALMAALAAIGVLAALAWPGRATAKPEAGLFTSLPIIWAESTSVGEALDAAGEPHWARTALEQDYRLVPLDMLEPSSLAPLRQIIVAQPRPLSPAENVALDDWLRKGGRALLFVDPLLTEHSRFALGDKRRPQDVALLSPILTRWGLELQFDDEQAPGERVVGELPVRIAGRWRIVAPGAPARCRSEAEGLIAECRIGQGRALLVADAALLEAQRGASPALNSLATRAFAR